MVNAHKVEGMLRNLRQYLSYLREIAQIPAADLLKDPIKIGSARYYLQISIETCLNLGNHIIASKNFRAPTDYRDVFTVLNENGVLSDDFTLRLRQMAGLRNRLVHLYWEVDDAPLFNFLQNDLSDFDQFIYFIENYLADEL